MFSCRCQQSFALTVVVLVAGMSMSAAEDRSQKQRKVVNRRSTQHTPISRDQIESAFERPCPTLDFPGEIPLSEVVDALHEYWPMVLDYKVRFVEDFTELDQEGITSLEDITVRNINLAAGSHTCRDALNLIFDQTSEPELTFVPMSGHILVTTLAKAESDEMLETRIYDVSDILPIDQTDKTTLGSKRPNRSRKSARKPGGKSGKKAHGKKDSTDDKSSPNISNRKSDKTKPKTARSDVLKQFGGASATQNRSGKPTAAGAKTDMLVELLLDQTVPPARWYEIDGEGGALSVYGPYIAIRQTYRVHEHIENILNQLREAIKISGPPKVSPKPKPKIRTPQQGGFSGGGGSFF